VLGIRPEHFAQSAAGHAAQILAVEPTGAETQVVTRFAGSEVMIALRERISAQPGESLTISPLPGSLHLFDAGTGLRIN
jgi:multiple sugar transport system ATP-binding protein